MSTIIRIKRSSTAGNPSTLGDGELAYSSADYSAVSGGGRLYIGAGAETGGDAASHLVIGGQYFTDMLDHAAGTLTASSALIVDADSKIDILNIDNLTLNGNTLSSTDTNGNVTISPNGTGNVNVSNAKIINVATPTANTDAANKAYVDDQVSGNTTFTLSDGSTTDNISMGQTLVFDGGTGVTTSVTDNQVSFAIGQDVGTSANVSFGTVTANLTGNVTGNVTGDLTGDVTGTVSSLSNHDTDDVAEGATNLYFTNARVDTEIDSYVTGGTGVTVSSGEISIGQAVGTTSNVTFNDVTVSGALNSDDITAATMTASGNVVVQGNLTVNGTTTTVNSNTVEIGDSILTLNSDETGAPSQNGGLEIERGTATNVSFLWDETADKWTIGSGTFVAGTVEADITGDITGNLTGNVTGDVTGDLTGNVTGNVTGDVTGNADTATALATARTIGGVSFDGTANIDLPGVNTTGNQDTSGNAATATLATSATALATARNLSLTGDATATLSGFDGSANVSAALTLANSGVTAASYGSSTEIPVLTVDAKGRVTAASTASISTTLAITDGTNNNDVALGSDTLTFTGGTGLTSTVGTDEVTFTLDDTAVTAGSYGNGANVATFTVDAQGRLTAAAATAISITASAVTDFDEAAQDAVGSMIDAGAQTNITVSYDDANNLVDYAVATATTSTLGVASFDSDSFTVTSGAVSITTLDGGSYS